ncbi:MAG TPA: 4-alpha-glucanotransferase [Desulfobacterales bacterium]|nr:4-alpha-glucanotransferase [Desulfobacterales bacterium]HIP40833.1 4-alpha-glucanotransferase [Desulfocapsa sulfexigens]
MTTPTCKRASGILAHISSLPSPHGIGDIGYSAYGFLDFLEGSGQSLWQFLPTGPTNPIFDNSPYMSTSAFAGSPLLISLDLLVKNGLLKEQDLNVPQFSEYQTRFKEVISFKTQHLRLAFKRFDTTKDSFLQFKKRTVWLRDYCLFKVLKEEYNQKGWFDWPKELACRNHAALEHKEKTHSSQMEYFAFEQFIFFSQWQELRKKAKEKHIRLIGDIPIYVGWDSVDVWANQSIFALDKKTHAPVNVAGVPPDYFSKTGQRWGNPLYQWGSSDQRIVTKLYSWWTERFRTIFTLVDIARIDHFRGFEAYWSIPSTHKTAINGKWVKGPGIHFFQEIYRQLGPLQIIAEDLGEITPEVTALRDALNFPGMKVLQFAFDGNVKNSFLPFNFTSPNSVIYTGTHDNDTTVGWYLSNQLTDETRKTLLQYCNHRLNEDSEIHKDLIHLALSSISRYAIFPLQDILGFGNDCKMNSPGSKKGNWAWRCAPRFLTDDISGWLYNQCELFGRLPQQTQPDNKNNEKEKTDA